MRAIKMQGHVEKAAKPTHSLADSLARLPRHLGQLRTKEEVDGYLEQERQSWD